MFAPLMFIFLVQAAFPANAVDKSAGSPVHKPSPPPTPAVNPSPTKTSAHPRSKQPSASQGQAQYHRVKPGETLYRIGVNTGIGHKLLAEWNDLPPDYLVKAGQTLKLFPSNSAPGAKQALRQTPPVKTEQAAEKKEGVPAAATGTIKITPLGDSIKVTPLADPAGPDNQRVNKSGSKSQNLNSTQENKSVGNIIPLKSLENKKNIKSVATKAVDPSDGKGKLDGTKKPKTEAKKPIVSTNNKGMLKLNFQWPLKGVVLKNFSKSKPKAIGIASRMDKQTVKAAAAGKVLYQGRGLEDYQNLVVIKHQDDFLTVYANNSRILVKDGENISKGQAIAEISAATGKQKPLHFEIRKAGRPVDALSVLPAR